jgi:NAD(P)-dependent dehydrogenase (short-subunit alcohol dehydrogenase family)
MTSSHMAGRRILVTGGASGIGRVTVGLLTVMGATVAALDRDADGLAAVAADVGCHTGVADVGDDASVQTAVAAIAAAMGGIDGVVNAAGIHVRGTIGEVGPTEFRRALDVNLVGPYLVIRHSLSWLRQSADPAVVNVSSATGLLPNAPARSAYAASKGGLVALTRALAAELAPGIRVNSVCPGLVNTPMSAGVEEQASRHALQRLAEPEEIARAIAFLVGPDSSYVTGAALAVDGGRSFH